MQNLDISFRLFCSVDLKMFKHLQRVNYKNRKLSNTKNVVHFSFTYFLFLQFKHRFNIKLFSNKINFKSLKSLHEFA